jgi:flagellar basal-body rod modification protein FlgD
MTVASIGNTGVPTTPTNPSSTIGIQDFLRILTTQLNNQDPLKPMDNTEFVAQLAQFTALQEAQQTNNNLDSLLNIQAATQSVGLLGRTISVNSSGSIQNGRVTGIDFSTGQALLNVTVSSGQVLSGISLADVTNVQ